MYSQQTLENGYQDGAESLGILQFHLLVKLNILIHGISEKNGQDVYKPEICTHNMDINK